MAASRDVGEVAAVPRAPCTGGQTPASHYCSYLLWKQITTGVQLQVPLYIALCRRWWHTTGQEQTVQCWGAQDRNKQYSARVRVWWAMSDEMAVPCRRVVVGDGR